MSLKLTLGTAQFGLEYGINNNTGKPVLNKSIEMLEYAYLNGIKSIDTAAAYGNSEFVIGKWIESCKPQSLYITSKIPSIYNSNVLKNEVWEYVEKQVYSSLDKLRVNKLDNVMLHDYEDLVHYGEIIPLILIKLKDKGYTKNIGYSIYNLESIDILSKYNFDTIQFPSSIFNQSILESDKLINLKKKNVKTFVRSAFVQGLIFINPDKLPKELYGIKKYIIELNKLANDYNLTIREIAMNYLMHHENVDSIVFGVDNIDQLTEIIDIKKNNSIDKEIIKNKFLNIPKELVDPRSWRF
ncbi:aldo/keto reductase [Clostridium sporogenes]|uniref:aldo/keto reductase n=1 Tax=Clostridium sporogenes TaxID=1509 RepID=UPI001C11FE51|nr:aldo/keto reductase [Clostridium sporogenes]MBU5299946.1 aldo/keto reductase [Clostridium sporogenes]